VQERCHACPSDPPLVIATSTNIGQSRLVISLYPECLLWIASVRRTVLTPNE